MTTRTPEEIERLTAEFEQWADSLDLDDPNVTVRYTRDLRDVAAAREASDAATARLREAVRVARAGGWSWARIAIPLGVSKQAAMKRFGELAKAS